MEKNINIQFKKTRLIAYLSIRVFFMLLGIGVLLMALVIRDSGIYFKILMTLMVVYSTYEVIVGFRYLFFKGDRIILSSYSLTFVKLNKIELPIIWQSINKIEYSHSSGIFTTESMTIYYEKDKKIVINLRGLSINGNEIYTLVKRQINK